MCKALLSNNKCLSLINHLNGYHVLLKLFEHICQKTNYISKEGINIKSESKNQLILIEKKSLLNSENPDVSVLFAEAKKLVSTENEKVCSFPRNNDLFHPDFIFSIINDNIYDICVNENGCCFIQRTLDFLLYTDFGKLVICKILAKVPEYTNHIFANYIIQYIIMIQNNIYNCFILNSLKPDLLAFSTGKYSSKVIERLVTCYKLEQIVLIKSLTTREEHLRTLILSKYGNYGKIYFEL